MSEPAFELSAPPVVDGSRPLQVTRPRTLTAELQPSRHDGDAPLPCEAHRHALDFSEPIPAACRREIAPGEFFLLHIFRPISVNGPTRMVTYCAPCAVREYGHWGVREALA